MLYTLFGLPKRAITKYKSHAEIIAGWPKEHKELPLLLKDLLGSLEEAPETCEAY